MKKNLKFFAGALTTAIILGGGILASCTSEEGNGLFAGSNVIGLAKAPNVVAYSGDMVFGNTFANKGIATRASENGSFERWQSDRSWTKPNDIIEAERDYVLQYLQDHPNGGYKTLDIDEYVIQVVGNGGHVYNGDTADHNGAMHQVNASNEMNYCEIDGFFTQFNNTGMNSENCILIKNVQATNATYHDSYGNTWEDHYAFYFITFPDEEQYGYMAGKTGLYLCYDYATYKESEVWGVTADGVYDDWVIKLSPSDGTFFNEPEQPGQPGQPTTPAVTTHDNEVEVNLSINTEKEEGDYISSHLSIHVRCATDVEVFIPVPAEYYCDVDDMYIFEDRWNRFEYGTAPEEGNTTGIYTISYQIAGQTVTLTVKYESDGIRITTDGINETVINYCKEHYGDGITFEVWNYYNDQVTGDALLTREALKENLDQSTVKFLDKTPDYYINAFGQTHTYDEKGEVTGKLDTPWEWDCTVKIIDEQEQYYGTPYDGNHLNDSKFNKIYVLEGKDEH